jgi:16S rRNA (guanine1207-N2)-methyltransferase
VIRKQQGAVSAVNKLNELFGNCLVVERKKGFWILKSNKT